VIIIQIYLPISWQQKILI